MHSDKSNHKMKNTLLKLDDVLHKKLDKFIQDCLNKFQFVVPQKKFYDITGEDQNAIISHKSTIPDLVIWNKPFNKNNCFIDSNTSKINLFPRFKFYLRFDHSQEKKKSSKKKKNKSDEKNYNKNNFLANEHKIIENTPFSENDPSENISNEMTKINSGNKNCDIKKKNEENLSKENQNKNSGNIIQTNKLCLSQNHQHVKNYCNNCLLFNYDDFNNNGMYFNNFQNNNKPENIINSIQLAKISSNKNIKNQRRPPFYQNNFMNSTKNNKNKSNLLFQNELNGFIMHPYSVNQNKKIMNNYYQNQFKQNELLMNFVFSFLDKKGWIVFRNDGNYISNFTSFELFTFLTSILERNNDLKIYIIKMLNNPMSFNGEQIYIILSQTLPIILQKKQYELIHQETMKEKNIIKENVNLKINNETNKENDKEQASQDEIDYNLNIYKDKNENENTNINEEKNKDDIMDNDEEENYFNLNLYENNFFSNQQKENIPENFDSSIFGQNHQ